MALETQRRVDDLSLRPIITVDLDEPPPTAAQVMRSNNIADVLAGRLLGIGWAPAVPVAGVDELVTSAGSGRDRRPAARRRVGRRLIIGVKVPTAERPVPRGPGSGRALPDAPGGER